MKSLLEYVKTQAKLSGRQILSYDTLAEFPEEQVKELEVKGVLFQIKDADGIICTECDKECWKPVETRIKDGKAIGVIYCTDKDCGGIVPVELIRLQQWEIVKEKLIKLERGENEIDQVTLGIKEKKVNPQGSEQVGNNNIYREINLAERTLTIGENTKNITADSVWDLLKNLCTNSKSGLTVYRFDAQTDRKNAVDTLRRKNGTENLNLIIESVKGGYKLNPDVKIKGGGQIGIRKTKR